MVEPLLEKDGELIRAKITGRKRDALGNLVGCYDPNPLLNTRIYLAEFPDGYIQEYTADSIAESIYNHVDDDGNDELLFDAIIGYESKHQTPGPQGKYCTWVGTFVLHGRMAPPHGTNFLMCAIHTLCN